MSHMTDAETFSTGVRSIAVVGTVAMVLAGLAPFVRWLVECLSW